MQVFGAVFHYIIILCLIVEFNTQRRMSDINAMEILEELKLTRVPSMELEEKCFQIISTRMIILPSNRFR